jgi:methylglyoxal synthase
MVGFVKDHFSILKNMELTATGTTGSYVEQTGLTVDKKLSGPKGDYA